MLHAELNKRYLIIKEIGEGTFGKVYQAFDKKYNKDVALKIYKINS